jgi:hypothetical protein
MVIVPIAEIEFGIAILVLSGLIKSCQLMKPLKQQLSFSFLTKSMEQKWHKKCHTLNQQQIGYPHVIIVINLFMPKKVVVFKNQELKKFVGHFVFQITFD